MRLIITLLAAMFAFAFEAEARTCSFDLQLLNNATPATQARTLAAADSQFEPVRTGSRTVLETRSDTGVMWLRVSGLSGCGDPVWMSAKYPYLTNADLYAVSGDALDPDVRPVSTLPFMYPAWPLADNAETAASAYLIRIDYPDKIILPIHIGHSRAIAAEGAFFAFVSLALIIILAGQAFQAALVSVARSRPDSHAFIGFAAASATYVIISSGLLHTFIPPSLDLDLKRVLLVSQAVLVWMAVEFIRTSSPNDAVYPLGLVLRGLQHVAALTILAPWLWAPLAALCFQFAFFYAPLAIFAILAWNTVRREEGALGLLLAWSPTLLATIWVFSRLLGLTPYLEINHYIVGIALVLTSLRFNAIISLKYRQDAHAARHDTLTGLPNRRALEDIAARYDAGRFSIRALAMIDLKKFKAVNDTYGHSAGDRLLAHVAHNARRVLPKGAEIYRIGGDEFVLLVEAALTRSELETLVRTIGEGVAEPLDLEDEMITATANIGAVIGPIDPGTSFSRILKQADQLAYAAKSADQSTIRMETWNPQKTQAVGDAPGSVGTRKTGFEFR